MECRCTENRCQRQSDLCKQPGTTSRRSSRRCNARIQTSVRRIYSPWFKSRPYLQKSSGARRHTFNATTDYNWQINDDNNFKFLLGMNLVTYDYEDNWSQITDLTDITNPQFDLAVGTQTASGNQNGKVKWVTSAVSTIITKKVPVGSQFTL